MSFPRLLAIACLSALFSAVPAVAAPGCPGAVVFQPDASGAVIDAGWNGIAHDRPSVGYMLHLGVSCAAPAPPCGICDLTGPLASGGNGARCRNDSSIVCTPGTEVADCGGAGRCGVFAGPPTPIDAGGVEVCYTSQIVGPVTGTVNVETGSLAPDVPMRVALHVGSDADHSCPPCVGDSVPDDDVRGGLCVGGDNAGGACDADAVSPFPDFGATSLDCPPAGQAFVGDLVFGTVRFSTERQSLTLTEGSPRCLGVADKKCACDTCNGPGAFGQYPAACSVDADCLPSGGAPGVCGGRRCIGGLDDGLACRTCVGGSNDTGPCSTASVCPGGTCVRPSCGAGVCSRLGQPTQPNACFDDTAQPGDGTLCADVGPVGDGKGECGEGPVIGRCSVASGHAQRDCIVDQDCCDDGNCIADPPTFGDCEYRARPCFTDNGVVGGSIDVAGIASPPVGNTAAPTELAAVTCLASTTLPAGNAAMGLPGPARLRQPGALTFVEGDGLCPPALDPTCRLPFKSGKAEVHLVDEADDRKDRVQWNWLAGTETLATDFGNPVGSDEYRLCLYDGDGHIATLIAPAGESCGGKPCWTGKRTGFEYKDPELGPSGLFKFLLKAGRDGKAKIELKGKSVNLPMPVVSTITSPLTVQLRNAETGRCWSATYSAPFTKFDGITLKDTAD